MLMLLSPAKTLDYASALPTNTHSLPDFIPRSAELIELLRQLSPSEVGSLMQISDPLAQLNGDVYEGLDAASLRETQLAWAQDHLRILSGLYGVLRPLDLMQPYRLEMGTRLGNAHGKDLYAFWGERVTHAINAALAQHPAPALINLASEEYFKVVKPALLTVPVITPVFEDWKGGKYKIISFYAKRARGLMARFAIDKKITKPAQLKKFDREGYAFDTAHSSPSSWVFRRRLAD